ncbi:MAG: hypothetical protein J6U98_01965 [Abditibacteriota bacterium]|nr:hypothetical protein [Abditibacteriota bacterium]MBP5094267.1 hypothetical protein [Abditibacteriota bacterium]
MKKLIISAIAIFAVCSAAAMADSTAVNWVPYGDSSSMMYDFNGTFVFAGPGAEIWGAQASLAPEWLYNPNDTLSIGINGFDETMFDTIRDATAGAVDLTNNEVGMVVKLMNGDNVVSTGTFSVVGGFFSNGTYDITGNTASFGGDDYNVAWTNSVAPGTLIDGIAFSLSDGDIASVKQMMTDPYLSAMIGMRIVPTMLTEQGALFVTGSVIDGPEAETEVPEPATFAYGIMGLASLMGMKKRFGK